MSKELYSPELAATLARNDTLMQITRNALLVAGEELGESGDHWPAIQAMIKGVEGDHNLLQNELIIQEQLRKATEAAINELLAKIPSLPAEKQAAAVQILREMQDIYDASFGAAPELELELAEMDEDEGSFAHWRAADALIKQLGEK